MRLLESWQQCAHTAAFTGSSDRLLCFERMLRYRGKRTAGSARRKHTQHHRQQRRPARAEHSVDGWCRLACQVLDCPANTTVGVCRVAQHCSPYSAVGCFGSLRVLCHQHALLAQVDSKSNRARCRPVVANVHCCSLRSSVLIPVLTVAQQAQSCLPGSSAPSRPSGCGAASPRSCLAARPRPVFYEVWSASSLACLPLRSLLCLSLHHFHAKQQYALREAKAGSVRQRSS